MPAYLSRREFARLLQLGLLLPLAQPIVASAPGYNFRIRTITAGLNMNSSADLGEAAEAVGFLRSARSAYEKQGYEVQTLRLATQPMWQYLPDWTNSKSLSTIKELDRFAVDNNVSISIGPVNSDNSYHPEFADWATELIRQTNNLSFTVNMASTEGGIHHKSIKAAAEAILTIGRGTEGGVGNFRFAANAFTPPGTPFFPAAYFDNGRSFSLGLETPNLLKAAFTGATGLEDAKQKLRTAMNNALNPVADLARQMAGKSGWQYLGIDASPAPGLDSSIGTAIETLTGLPFGSHKTLSGCAAITDVLKSLEVQTCGYSGLMLPIMEDSTLALRAEQGLFSVSELLLYSSVCGTGLDVVPIPGDTKTDTVAALLTDVAALANKYSKPLSARLFPAPGKLARETVSFDNPHLTDAVVMPIS